MKRLISSCQTAAASLGLAACASTAPATDINASHPPPPKPAYMVVLGTVTNREAFMSEYAAKLPPLYEKYGGYYLAIGGSHEVLEGETTFESHVISAWPGGVDAARTFWESPEYEALKKARIDGGWGNFDVFLVEGMPGADAPVAAKKSHPPDE